MIGLRGAAPEPLARPLLRPRAVPARLALALVLLAVHAPAALRVQLEIPAPAPACAPEGRGAPPRHWLGCPADPGPRRDLADDERLALGLPLDPNTAGARELAYVPGLSRRLAERVGAERSRRPFADVEELRRVRGVGPRRLDRARSGLAIAKAR